ncbi:MAG: hypothetical protein EOO13_13850 [Chitinophagaceae bacterium]|nr:MAG: hypothetical protein EOO13_13850 [Chitinophagaceae bacterium]
MGNIFQRISRWETWPFKLIYAPLVPFWFGYILRSRAVWFFTPSNPKLTFGGLDGEPKKEMYNLLPPALYPATFNVLPKENFEAIQERILSHGIAYPLIVKPEVGCAGVLFRKIDTEKDLRSYHNQVPVEYIVQELVTYPVEVSVFYIRHPNEARGKVTGFLHKIPMSIVGDDFHTVEQLVLLHPKAGKRIGELHSKHKDKWHTVLPQGEKYMLSHAANHNRGAHFVDLKEHIDDKLVAIFDELSHRIDDFFYGRYDILCNSIEDLKEGKNYSILEYNGCGAEPNHIYDTGYTLTQAYKEILKHWKALYEVSLYNRKKGIKPWPYMKGLKFRNETKKHFRLLQAADKKIS